MNSNQKIIDAYDLYGDIGGGKYYAYKYNSVPSKLKFEAPLKVSKANFEQAIQLLALDEQGLNLVLKKWEVSNRKDDGAEKTHPYLHFYDSDERQICIEVELAYAEIMVEFHYDCRDIELENWVLVQLKALQLTFGKTDSPVFRVLTKSRDGFQTEKIDVDFMAVNIAEHYNDDFVPVDEVINKSLEKKSSGLILLHGKPGTGKTSYIKHLVTKHTEQKFIFIPNDFVNELLQPDFITFLIAQRNAILIIEDAEKVIMSRDLANRSSVVSTILQLTDGLFSDYLNIKVICTFNTDKSRIDNALFRKGRMIAFYEFNELSKEKTKVLLAKLEGDAVDGALTLAEIYHYQAQNFEGAERDKGIGFRKK